MPDFPVVRRGRTGGDTRRFVTVIQDERGYPAPGQLDFAPPDGPKPPVVVAVVKADEYEALLKQHFGLIHPRILKLDERLVKTRSLGIDDIRILRKLGKQL